MRVYYAHPISLYDTPQEERDVETLERLGFEVCNPNAKKHAAGYKKRGMEYFITLVEGCDVLAFRAFPDGSISAGVAYEVTEAERAKKPVFELPTAVKQRTLSADETRIFLCESGAR